MEQLSALSLEELSKRKSMLKSNLITLIILCAILLLADLYIFISKSKPISAGAIVPLLVIRISWIPIFSSLKSVNEEIKSRMLKITSN